jgi:predicted nucleic acid-binding Zn ribbon protein
MITYQWKCLSCNHINLVERKLKDSSIPPQTCTRCKNDRGFVKVLSATPLIGPKHKGNWQNA